MSLGDLPFHYVNDRHGDQVALPCTERNLTSEPTQLTLGRGFMPVVWIKGRNEVRLGSFRSLGGDEISGPWADAVPAPRTPPGAGGQMNLSATLQGAQAEDGATSEAADSDDADLSDLDDLMADDAGGDADDGGLDDLLAGFGDDTDDDDDSEMDAELAALLEGL